MDTPPVPKPRSAPPAGEARRPVPAPRTKLPGDRVSASDILRSIGSVSKQLTEDVALKVSTSAKSANEKIEKSIQDGSKFAKGTLEKTITTSRAVRDSVTKSVIEGTRTAGMKLRRPKKSEALDEMDGQRCVSMPVVDVSLFDNIQFHSPLLEQKRYMSDAEHHNASDLPSLNLNTSQFDDLSIFSTNSDSNADTVSNFSYDSRESDQTNSVNLESEQLTYDTPKPSRANSIVSSRSTPEVPERRKKRDSKFEVMRQNSMYENWTLPNSNTDSHKKPLTNNNETNRPSKSTIYEFDPLNTSNKTAPKYDGVSNELLLLESFLIGDTYGSIVTTDNVNDSFEFHDTEYYNPPTPPERSDSLFPETETKTVTKTETAPVVEKDSNSNWFVTNETETKTEETRASNAPSVMQKFSSMLKLDNMLNKTSKPPTPAKVSTVERPPVNNLPVTFYSGTMTKVQSGGVEELFKNTQSRFCVLSDQKLLCYTDPTNSILKESYPLETINSLQVVLPLSYSTTSNSYQLELSVANGARGPRKVVFSCASASERRNWAQKIAEHLAGEFPTKYTAEFTRCGWCYLKEGVSGEWRGAWVMLIRRVLVYYTARDAVCAVDLRKTRCVVTHALDDESKQMLPAEGSDALLLDCPRATLYLSFPHERDLKGWRYMVKLAAHNNGAQIHHQQLTKEDVPTVVDKCLSFIYAHGSLSEGIYRRAGSNVVLSELLARFRRDAWSVQLSPGQHSEHDVAGVLKRFFRDLPEPLLAQSKSEALLAALEQKDPDARNAAYRRVVTSLPLVARNTARKLFAHLHFLHSMADANKMTAENLASVWAPTVMPAAVTSNTLQTAWSAKEVFVVRDLIAHYEGVWEPTEAERRREGAVRRVLARVLGSRLAAPPAGALRAWLYVRGRAQCHQVEPTEAERRREGAVRRVLARVLGSRLAAPPAGALRAWLYVRGRAQCHQVELTPNKTSADICTELCEKANAESHQLMLEEVICNESMRRVVHKDEIVLDVVLRWGYWDEEDRKDNYLVIKENKLLHEMEALRSTSMVCAELRFAGENMKAFKLHMFEFQNGKLCYFKDKQGSHKIDEWNIKDILWYVGHEPKRNPQSRWAITFIPRNNKPKRSKDRPWFGCTIAGAVSEEQLRWTAAMSCSEHAELLPTPRLIVP